MPEDVAQEALVRGYVRWRRLRRHPNPKAWVARVSTNLASGDSPVREGLFPSRRAGESELRPAGVSTPASLGPRETRQWQVSFNTRSAEAARQRNPPNPYLAPGDYDAAAVIVGRGGNWYAPPLLLTIAR